MIPFRKHAPESTGRPNSLLFRFARRASLVARVVVAAQIIFLLAAPPWADAAPTTRQQGHAKSHTEVPKAAAQREDGKETHGRSEQPATDAKIPIRVTRVETPDGPSVLATIGDFPSDLNEAGQEFLKLEFFEHFASDVMGVGDSDSPRTTLKVALLPQEKENQREADFRLGKVSGHMVVLVEKRRVLVACTFSETEQTPQLLAFVGRLGVGTVAAE